MADPIRSFPTQPTEPGESGLTYTGRVADEGNALWDRIVSPTTSVGGTANAITATCVPPLVGTPNDSATFRLTPTAGSTTAVQINLDGRGLVDLKDCDGNALVSGDIVNGRPIEFHYFAAASNYRLTQPTQRALVAAAVAGLTTTGWEKINSSVISGLPSNVEHTFTAGNYSVIKMVGRGFQTNSVVKFVVSLRHSGGFIVQLTQATAPVAGLFGWEANFVVATGTLASTNLSNGTLDVDPDHVTSATGDSHAADRVRVAPVSGTLFCGTITTYGLKA